MPGDSIKPGNGARLHQFLLGAIPIIAYLLGMEGPVWAALALSLAAVASKRLIVLGWLWSLMKPRVERPTLLFYYHGVHRLDEASRAILLAAGLATLRLGQPIGWLPILAASAIAVLAGTTSFSFVTVFYAVLKAAALRVAGRRVPAAPQAGTGKGNPKCLVCRTLDDAPYHRCIWCNLPSIRSCCALQTSLLLTLMLVVAFLMTSTLSLVITKLLVSMSIVGVVALALAITRQTDELVETLERLADERRQADRRCAFLGRLTMATSLEEVAEETVVFIQTVVGARRVSVMLADGNVLRIIASRGIPPETVEQVAVPIGERVCGRVFQSGKPIVLRNILSERPHEALGIDIPGAVASYPLVAAQMSAGGLKLGVINATDKPGGEFSPRELMELEFVSGAAAISLASQLARQDLARAPGHGPKAVAMST